LFLLSTLTSRGGSYVYLGRVSNIRVVGVTDALSTMLRLLGEELEVASWLMGAWSRMDPIELCDEEW